MFSSAPPLTALVLFSTGAFTKTTYYNSLIKPCLQTEHRHCKRFAAFSLCANTKFKTTNSSIQMTLAISADFGWEIPWKSCCQMGAQSTTSRQPSRRLKLLYICAIEPLPLYRAFQSLGFHLTFSSSKSLLAFRVIQLSKLWLEIIIFHICLEHCIDLWYFTL